MMVRLPHAGISLLFLWRIAVLKIILTADDLSAPMMMHRDVNEF